MRFLLFRVSTIGQEGLHMRIFDYREVSRLIRPSLKGGILGDELRGVAMMVVIVNKFG